jgi:hypothetical protein
MARGDRVVLAETVRVVNGEASGEEIMVNKWESVEECHAGQT